MNFAYKRSRSDPLIEFPGHCFWPPINRERLSLLKVVDMALLKAVEMPRPEAMDQTWLSVIIIYYDQGGKKND